MSRPTPLVGYSIEGPATLEVDQTLSTHASTSGPGLNRTALGLPSVFANTPKRYHLMDGTVDPQGRLTSAADGVISQSDLPGLVDSGVTAGTRVLGIVQSFDAKGRITEYSNLDNTGGNGPLTRSYVGSFKGAKTINDSSATILLFDAPNASYKNTLPSWVNTATGVSTIPATGWYDIYFNSIYNTNSAAQRSSSLFITTSDPVATGVVLAVSAAVGAAAAVASNHIAKTYRFTTGDTFWFSTTHNIGAPTSCAFDFSVKAVTQSQ